MSSQPSFDAAIVIGRFQPFHNGHLALVRRALSLAPRVVLIIGSAFGARTVRNPWQHQERAAMILQALSPEQRARVTCVPLRDYYDEPRWRRELVYEVNTQLGRADANVVVVGHFKDTTSAYLRGFAGWQLDSLPLQGNLHATSMRERYFSEASPPAAHGDDTPVPQAGSLLDTLAPHVPASTLDLLERFRATTAYGELVHELDSSQAYQKSWQAAPFPPVFVTVDAVVTCQSHVLLIQRGKTPGLGLWALPGGFLDLSETTLQSSLRELREETGLALDGKAAEPVDNAVFDHPLRSARGRTISHVYHFALHTGPVPHVVAADDARACRWVRASELLGMEQVLFEDHLLILDRFLHLLPQH